VHFEPSPPDGDGHFFVLVATDDSVDAQAMLSLLGGLPVILAISVNVNAFNPGAERAFLAAQGHSIVTCVQAQEIQRPVEG
jgi:hypothetical protein